MVRVLLQHEEVHLPGLQAGLQGQGRVSALLPVHRRRLDRSEPDSEAGSRPRRRPRGSAERGPEAGGQGAGLRFDRGGAREGASGG